MTDQSALLGQLRIDRQKPDSGHEPSRLGVWVAVGLALALIGVGTWSLLRGDSAVVVHAVAARALTTSSGEARAASILDSSGYVVARRQATVSAKITGKVTEVLIEEGQKVSAGEIVARLDDTNIRASFEQARASQAYAQANVEQLRVQLANADRDYARKQSLLASHYVSQADLDNSQTARDELKAQLATAERNVDVSRLGVEVAQRSLNDTVIRAPFAGVITVKAAQPGEIVSPISAGGGFTRTGIGTIVDMDSLEIEVDVNESFINRVHPGQPALAKLNAYPDWEIPTQVIAVIPTADRTKATVKVRIGFKQKDPRILPEMGVRVSFLAESSPAAGTAGGDDNGAAKAGSAMPPGVVVPDGAVQVQGGGTGVVYLLRGDTVERRAVKLGAKSADGQMILSGLTAGDRIAIGPADRLADGIKVKVAD